MVDHRALTHRTSFDQRDEARSRAPVLRGWPTAGRRGAAAPAVLESVAILPQHVKPAVGGVRIVGLRIRPRLRGSEHMGAGVVGHDDRVEVLRWTGAWKRLPRRSCA